MKMDHDVIGFDENSDPRASEGPFKPSVESTNWVGHQARVPPKAARSGPRPSWSPGQRSVPPAPVTGVVEPITAVIQPAGEEPRSGRRSGRTPAPVGRVAIPIAPGPRPDPYADEVPRPASFRTPAPAAGREFDFAGEHAAPPSSPAEGSNASTLVLVGAGLGAATAAVIGSVGVIAVVVAAMVFLPGRSETVAATPGAPVVVTARTADPGPSRAVVSRGGAGAEASGAAAGARSAPAPRRVAPVAPGTPRPGRAATTGVPATDGATAAVAVGTSGARNGGVGTGAPAGAQAPVYEPVVSDTIAPEPKGWVEATVDAVTAFVAPEPEVPATPSYAPARVAAPEVGGDVVDPRAAALAPAPTVAVGVAAAGAPAPSGDVSIADQVVVSRPGTASWGAEAAPVGAPTAAAGGGWGNEVAVQGRPLDQVAVPAGDWGSPAPADAGWRGAVDTVTSLVTSTLGGDPGAGVVPGTEPAGGAFVADDGLDDLTSGLAADRGARGWDTPAAADDPAMALLAELDRPAGAAPAPVAAAAAPVAAAPIQPSDDMGALLSDLGSDHAADASGGGWYDTVVAVGSSVAALVTGDDSGFVPATPGAPAGDGLVLDDDLAVGVGAARTGWNAQAGSDDPALRMLADLDAPGEPHTPGARPVAAGAAGAPAAPAPVDDRGAPVDDWGAPPAARGAADGAAALDLSDDESLPGRPAPVAAPAVDPMAALLADLDRPAGPAPGSATSDGWAPVGSAPAVPVGSAPVGVAPVVAAGADGWAPVGSAPVGSAPVGTAAATAVPAAAPQPAGWYDTVVAVGSSVASLVTSGDGGDPLFAPSAPAEPTGPGLTLDDDLSVGAGRARDGWNTQAGADDAAMRMLADLDTPGAAHTPGVRTADPAYDAAGRVVSKVTPPQSLQPDQGPDGLADDPTGALIASLGDDRVPAPDPSLLATVTSWGGAMANAVLGAQSPAPTQELQQADAARVATMVGVGAGAPAGSGTPGAFGTPTGFGTGAPSAPAYFAPAAMAPAAPVVRQCLDGELCDDESLGTWRDDGSHGRIDVDDDLELTPSRNKSDAELFAAPAAGVEGDGAAFDGFHTLLVNVTTDVPGIPVEIDGHDVGSTPLTAEVTPGRHAVRLHGGGDAITLYTLEATRDPDQWCFELKGRSLKYVTCR